MDTTTATTKYLALDVHQATCSFTLRAAGGRILERGVVETTARELVALVRRLGRNLHVTFEEGTQAQWLHDLLVPHSDRVLVCNPRGNRDKVANKADRIDADKLSELLRVGSLKAVYHGSAATRPLKEFVRAYTALVGDSTRVMLRIKAIYRARGLRTKGSGVYRPALRKDWLAKIAQPAARRRAELFFAQLDALSSLRGEAKRAMLAEARKHPAFRLLQTFPFLGPVRAAEILAILGSPHRFRTRRNLWPYAGLAVVRQSSADYEVIDGRIHRRTREPLTRGLNRNYNRVVKKIFKSIASELAQSDTPLGEAHRARVARGVRPELALLTLARIVAAILLAMWKKGVPYDPTRWMSEKPK